MRSRESTSCESSKVRSSFAWRSSFDTCELFPKRSHAWRLMAGWNSRPVGMPFSVAFGILCWSPTAEQWEP